MLLCEGKLCLRVVQEIFNLTIVEIMHGMLSTNLIIFDIFYSDLHLGIYTILILLIILYLY